MRELRRTFVIQMTHSVDRPFRCDKCGDAVPPWTPLGIIYTHRTKKTAKLACVECVAVIQRERIERSRDVYYDRADRQRNGYPETEFVS